MKTKVITTPKFIIKPEHNIFEFNRVTELSV